MRLNKAGLPLLSRCCCFGRSCLLRPDRRAGVSEGRRQGGLAASPDSCAGQHRWRSGRALRARLIGACVLVAVAGLPGTSAGLAPPQQSGDQFEMRRLAEVRQGLERRRQLQRSLQGQVDELARKIDDLRVQLESTSTLLQSERQEALALERRLDQLVPRFLARMAEAREHRARAARALADLAGKSRSPHLDARMRARMSALSPLMLQRLGNAEAGLGIAA